MYVKNVLEVNFMTKVENIITKEVFETMCIMHIQRYHDLLIMNVDTNLMGNVKYIEGYNKDTQKKNIDCNSFRRLSRGKLVGSVRAGV